RDSRGEIARVARPAPGQGRLVGLQEDPDRTRSAPGDTTRVLIALLASTALLGCAKTEDAPAATATSGSGTSGSVVAGPTCPVERPDRPCPPRPVSGATVTANPGGKSTRTDAHGNFVLQLPVGTYDLSVASRSVMHSRA